MQVSSLKISSFRLFDEKQLTLDSGINWILGENATGKTSLLEALYLLISARSFRTNQMQDLVKGGNPFFRVEVEFEKRGVFQSLKMSFQDKDRRIHHNATELLKLSSLLGVIHGVLLAPDDIELIKGAKSSRRLYLDQQIAQVDSQYIYHLSRYVKAVKHRNAALRLKKMASLDVLEEVIADSSAYICEQRALLIEGLNPFFSALYQEISGKKESVSLRYCPSFGITCTSHAILEKLKHHRLKDSVIGYTTIGPHRDDLKISLKNHEADGFASEGEMRSIACAMRLAEWKKMEEKTALKPLLLVDDFGISLDPSRLHNLSDIFSSLGQVVITSVSHVLQNKTKAPLLQGSLTTLSPPLYF